MNQHGQLTEYPSRFGPETAHGAFACEAIFEVQADEKMAVRRRSRRPEASQPGTAFNINDMLRGRS